ncbi:MAG: Holliday junction resolvase RuvX [Oscillospiraceae bacterium]|nr:Holliday junction resolvase RuvX [Oscillospiraceae bacterium]
MGIDFGSARTGLAVCDSGEILASPVGQVDCVGKSLGEIARIVVNSAKEHGAEEFVLGYPRNMDGTVSESGEKVERFREKLLKISEKSVTLRDERLTTVMGGDYLSQAGVYGKKRAKVLDAAAAVVILQEFLDYRKSMGICGN